MPNPLNPQLSDVALATSPRNPELPPELLELLAVLGQSGAGPAADALGSRATPPSEDFISALIEMVLRGDSQVASPPVIEPQLGQGTIGTSRDLLGELLG